MFRGILIVFTLTMICSFASAEGVTIEGQIAFANNIFMNGDYDRALIEYEKAKTMDSGRAEIYYFIGCLYYKKQMNSDALSSFQTALTLAGDTNANLHAKTLFRIALLHEQTGDYQAATLAWNDYITYAQAHPDAQTFVPSAKSRIDMIAKKKKLDADYMLVRGRIEKSRSE